MTPQTSPSEICYTILPNGEICGHERYRHNGNDGLENCCASLSNNILGTDICPCKKFTPKSQDNSQEHIKELTHAVMNSPDKKPEDKTEHEKGHLNVVNPLSDKSVKYSGDLNSNDDEMYCAIEEADGKICGEICEDFNAYCIKHGRSPHKIRNKKLVLSGSGWDAYNLGFQAGQKSLSIQKQKFLDVYTNLKEFFKKKADDRVPTDREIGYDEVLDKLKSSLMLQAGSPRNSTPNGVSEKI